MSINVTGTIERKEMGTGTWALVTDDGTTYEIYRGASKDLLKPGQKVNVVGQIKEDVMTLAMIGSVLEVKSFDVISSD
jgi:cytochrome c-type biogenesis protein CcmE